MAEVEAAMFEITKRKAMTGVGESESTFYYLKFVGLLILGKNVS